MSSLLQFNGTISKKGVHLETYKCKRLDDFPYREDLETYKCNVCGREHPHIYIFIRKPIGMCGCWVVFRWNNEEHVPDLSCPFGLEKMPRDAKRLNEEESSKIWHSN